MSDPPKPAPWIGIAGPTASGKTVIALEIARRRPVEIISVDSVQVYRGLDIGTAKPGPDERAQVPHHLIDILDPAEAYSAARFADDARRLIAEIAARGRLPLLVGGTMLYYKALIDGLDPLPAADPAVRTVLDEEARARGWPALHAELARVDPATAARLQPNDAQRIQRALEVWRVSGQPLSALHGRRASSGSPYRLITLEPASRGWLHQRIAERFEHMLSAGFWNEVLALRRRGDLHDALPAIRSVGYRQAWALAGRLEAAGRNAEAPDLALLSAEGIAATRQLAKRQLTWLRSMPGRTSVAADDPAAADIAARQVEAAVG